MIKRLSAWYEGLRPIEDYVAAGLSPRARNNIRSAIIVIAALPGIALVESYFINRPWRDFYRVGIKLPEPIVRLDVGQPWPSDVSTTLLADLLPPDVAAVLPADAAVPQGQKRLSVLSIVEQVESLNTPVLQSWLSSFTNPEGDTVTTEVALWCGFDLEKSPAERLCIATVPVPLFGRVTSASCLVKNGFALYHTLLRSDLCEHDEHENICSQLPVWRHNPPSQGQVVKIDDLQCAASIILPYLTLTMTHDGVRIDSETISPFAGSFKADVEHGHGFTRSLAILAHDGASEGEISWNDLLDKRGVIPVSITPQTRAAGLVWTEYRSRHDIHRGDNGKEPKLKGSRSFHELKVALQPSSSFQIAAQFLGKQLTIPTVAGNLLSGIDASELRDGAVLPDACQPDSELPVVAQAGSSIEGPGYSVRLSQTVCPEDALKPALIQALFAN
ncbi:hypothetical protein IMCC3135_19390 [Granulosicoccus antarcticus IMCC3135]|uniref:Uncharacterized protein n=2 Tax=Granulosicoccus TaxID=437504 RepID=A0A2Z2P0Z3_9GAMM|nr:hypothetical protein IMCC3135_19390 [Granulosicoccus antarcticus IMCC3135]